MENIKLNIHQDEKFLFFQQYDKLGDLQKKIWQTSVWWCKRFPNAHPRQSKIAQKVGCSRKHVNKTFQTFGNNGWLHLLSRGIKRSKILCIPNHLLAIDVFKREYFRRIEVTTQVTHSYYNNKRLTSRASEIPKKAIEIPKLAQKLGFSKEAGLKLGLLPEYVLQETLYQCKKLGKQGFRPDSEERYFVGMAINMAKDKGHKIDWRRFYECQNI